MIKGVALIKVPEEEAKYLLNHIPIKNARPIYGMYVYLSETIVSPIDTNCTTNKRLTIKEEGEEIVPTTLDSYFIRNRIAES